MRIQCSHAAKPIEGIHLLLAGASVRLPLEFGLVTAMFYCMIALRGARAAAHRWVTAASQMKHRRVAPIVACGVRRQHQASSMEERKGCEMGWDGMGWDGMGWDGEQGGEKEGIGSGISDLRTSQPLSALRTPKMRDTNCHRRAFSHFSRCELHDA